MADKVLDILFDKYFKGMISYERVQRIEEFPVAAAATREAVLNWSASPNARSRGKSRSCAKRVRSVEAVPTGGDSGSSRNVAKSEPPSI
jgi:hypothetical protein